ncbi:excisionase [Flexivirga sp. ID2601S]|uniref:citrate synthase (unknown stereospecificity) n=1 Tax=Flexivirga aerilata TaxID=1656889 RepID=A0A849AKI4_9MICO|nr:excisionase [Flexivirga aerilata]
MSDDLISTQQAADLLGVRVATVYSYVSRGLLDRVDDGRSRHDGSRFARDQVTRLAARHHRPRRGVFELTVETAVTSLDPAGRLLFRGHDAGELAECSTFEEVAEIVWGATDPPQTWPTGTPAPIAYDAATRTDRIRLAIEHAAATDPERTDLCAHHFCTAGRRAIAAAVATLAASAVPAASVAAGLWAGLSDRPPVDAELRALDTALGLMADHELASSTLAARAAASTGADPYLVMLAGASAFEGPRHGQASAAAYDLLVGALDGGAEIPDSPAGFGHSIYTGTDPRFDVLRVAVGRFAPEVVEVVDELAVRVARRDGRAANVDLGLAALTVGAGLPRDAGAVIFLISRLAGFVAHGIEEQGHPLRFRPRATYTGRAETASGSGPT